MQWMYLSSTVLTERNLYQWLGLQEAAFLWSTSKVFKLIFLPVKASYCSRCPCFRCPQSKSLVSINCGLVMYVSYVDICVSKNRLLVFTFVALGDQVQKKQITYPLLSGINGFSQDQLGICTLIFSVRCQRSYGATMYYQLCKTAS